MTDIADPIPADATSNDEEIEQLPFSPEGVEAWQRKAWDPADYGPVKDWATDLDHADPEYNERAPEIWKELRESGCPVAHSERYTGMWTPVTHETVSEIAYDTENFTSRSIIVGHARPGDLALPKPIGGAPPITSDPPFHKMARRLLLPPFGPKKIEALEDSTRALCRQLLDNMGEVGPGAIIDGAVQYAQHIPVSVIRQMLGFPEADEDLFREFVHLVLETINEAPGKRRAAFEKLNEYILAQIEDHRANPRDDLTSYLLDVELEGQKLADEHVGGTIILILIAGIDTTWSAIGSSLWHLAQNPEDRVRLRDEPDLMDFALEEFLRMYAPVTMARLVAQDNDFHGCPMKEDDFVLLPFPAANRDPEAFDDPDTFVIDRQQNRHAAFGLGIHRCLGSNLARMELRVAVEEFTARFPDFELAGDVRWSVGQIRGPREMPLRVL